MSIIYYLSKKNKSVKNGNAKKTNSILIKN